MKKTALLVIVLLGLSLRVVGADWGFPFLLHPDEFVVADMPTDMAKRASLDPGEYNHPDHFDIYTNAAIHHLASRVAYGKPLTETFADHTLLFYHLSRIWAALLGTACIVAAYLVGREYSQRTGLIAAVLVALFQPYVNNSHFIAADIPLTLFILCAIWCAIRYLKKPGRKELLLGALFSALSVSVKYPGLISLLLMLSVVAYSHIRDRKTLLARLVQVLAAFSLFLFFISPYLFLSFDRVVRAITLNAVPVHLGADGLGWWDNIRFYAGTCLNYSGITLLLFSLWGGYCLIRREKIRALPVFTGLVYCLILSKIGLHWERWALPMYLTPLLLAAYGIDLAWEKAGEKGRGYAVALGSVLLLITAQLAVASAVTTAKFTLKDTRYVSYLFANEHNIEERHTLYEGYTPFYPSNMRDGSVRNAFYRLDHEKDIRYVIVSSAIYDRYLNAAERYPEETEFYRKVFALPVVDKFAEKEYFTGGSVPFYLDNDLAKGAAFLLDYARNRDGLLAGPSIQIYRYDPPGFLDRPIGATDGKRG